MRLHPKPPPGYVWDRNVGDPGANVKPTKCRPDCPVCAGAETPTIVYVAPGWRRVLGIHARRYWREEAS
jgi:hypothetical protein